MKREIFIATAGAFLLTLGFATMAGANAGSTDEATPIFSSNTTIEVAAIDCDNQIWPNIDATCLSDLEGAPLNKTVRAIKF